MKKLLMLLAVAFLVSVSAPALAAENLSAEQISQAQARGNKLVPKRKIAFAFASMEHCSVTGEFMPGDGEMTDAYAFWITPFCHVINEQMVQTRSGDRDFAAIGAAGQMYQLRLLLAIQNLKVEELADVLITVRQGDTVLHPSRVRYASLQRVLESQVIQHVTWHKVGIVLDFNAEDVAVREPVLVTVAGKRNPIKFGELGNDARYDHYDVKRHEFIWYPLNDSL